MLSRVRAACLVAALLPLLGLACSSEAQTARPAPAAPAGASTPAEDAGPEEHILYAYHLIRSYHVEEYEAARLLRPAWDGALQSARRRFVVPANIRPPDLSASDPEAEFRRAVRALVDSAPPDFNRNELAHDAIEAMAKSLADNHTYFMLPEAYRQYLANETVGLGYSGLELPEGLLIWYVYEGGPADRAGLRTGDVITHIDGRFAGRDDETDDRDRPRYRAGVPATLGIDRPGSGPLQVVVVPELMQRRILDFRVEGDVGYLRLYRFPPTYTLMPDGRQLSDYLDAALAELRGRGVRGWVLDLRNNPGGSEIVAAIVAARFGLKGALVQNKRRGGDVATIAAIGESGIAGLPLAILTNENSASSSELVTSALQQAGLARVFGQRTSGVVNTARSWTVAGGGGLFITTEKAFAGAEKLYLDGRGVYPDETVSLSRRELAQGVDTQLARALEWLRPVGGVPAGLR